MTTTYFSDIFNMTDEIVANKDSIVALIMVGVTIAVIYVVVGWIKGLFGNIKMK